MKSRLSIAGIPIAGLALAYHAHTPPNNVVALAFSLPPPSVAVASASSCVRSSRHHHHHPHHYDDRHAYVDRRSTLSTKRRQSFSLLSSSSSFSSSTDADQSVEIDATDEEALQSLNLTPELAMMTKAFASIPDEKTRHKQLLYMASKLPSVADDDVGSLLAGDAIGRRLRVPQNKVPGCLSTVHVDCTVHRKSQNQAETDERKGEEGEYVVNYYGDSDGLLTKGLLALLIRGLSGCTTTQITQVDPKFIRAAKISQTLTPGRNNGFLNMLNVMKNKALEAVADAKNAGGVAGAIGANGTKEVNGANGAEEVHATAANGVEAVEASEAVSDANDKEGEGSSGSGREVITSFEPMEGKPMYNTIMNTLITVLKPTSIRLIDNSHQHSGHIGAKGWEESGESHFALDITAEAFEGLALVKRHQVIYMLLGEVMTKIHALEIKARSPSEV